MSWNDVVAGLFGAATGAALCWLVYEGYSLIQDIRKKFAFKKGPSEKR